MGHQKLEEAVKESSLEPKEGSSLEPMFLDFLVSKTERINLYCF